MGETIRRSFVRTWMGEISELGMHVVHRKGYFCEYVWMISKSLERSRIWLSCGSSCCKMWILMKLHHFLTISTWDEISVNAKRMKHSLTVYKNV